MREIVNAVFYICAVAFHAGCCRPAFRRIRPSTAGSQPGAMPPRGSRPHHLIMQDRERVGREAGPPAGVIDSQSVKTTEAGRPRLVRRSHAIPLRKGAEEC